MTKTFFGNRKFRKLVGRDENYRPQYEDVFARIDVEIDIDQLMDVMGHNALRNKSGKAIGLNGLIKVTAKRLP